MRQRYGLTQQQVARAADIHQPDLSAIERGRATGPEMLDRIIRAIKASVRPSEALALHGEEMVRVLESMGARNVRVFGSTLHGTDQPGSDVDLLAELPEGTGLLALIEMEGAAEKVLGVPVDLVPDDPGSAALSEARAEAVPL